MGPDKLVGFAKSLGNAWHEFQRGQSGEESPEHFKAVELAKQLGIETKGKSTTDLIDEAKIAVVQGDYADKLGNLQERIDELRKMTTTTGSPPADSPPAD